MLFFVGPLAMCSLFSCAKRIFYVFIFFFLASSISRVECNIDYYMAASGTNGDGSFSSPFTDFVSLENALNGTLSTNPTANVTAHILPGKTTELFYLFYFIFLYFILFIHLNICSLFISRNLFFYWPEPARGEAGTRDSCYRRRSE